MFIGIFSKDFSIFDLYSLKVGEKTRIRWFSDDNSVDNTTHPFSQRRRNLCRHSLNARHQSSVRQAYVASCKLRGVCDGVRGEAWLLQPRPAESPDQHTPFMALSYASLSESFYQALQEDPRNENLMISVKKGLEARVINYKCPPAVIRYLINLHNRFHFGSGTSWIELIQMVPDVS